MKKLTFDSLIVASPSQKSANQFKFHPKFNLITGPDNSIGKSTLTKLLLWTLGCEPGFDSTWKTTDSRCILHFVVDDTAYVVGRSSDSVVLREAGAAPERFDKVTGAYAKRLAEIVGFEALLPNRSDPTVLETPPPAYYFLPFYIDQRRSWSGAWNGFDSLQQYANWQRAIISYHTGYLLPKHFEYAALIAVEQSAAKTGKKSIERIDGAIAVVQELAPAVKSASVGQSVEQVITEISEDVGALHQKLDRELQNLAHVREQVAQLSAQRQLLETAAIELGEDYTFAVENTSGDSLQCPLCGTLHSNTLIERSGLLADKAAAEEGLRVVAEKETATREKAAVHEERVRRLRELIDSYADRFEDSEMPDDAGSDFITRLSSTAIQRMAFATKKDTETLVAAREKEGRRLKGLQQKLISKDEKENLNQRFIDLLRANVDSLGAAGVNLSGVESPLNYKRVFGSGGAAEGTRAALAYYLSVHTMVQEAENEAMAPLVVDTPNQHEQTDYNYEAALRLIKEKAQSSQIFLCAMDTEVIQQYKDLGKTIWLEPGKRILQSPQFDQIWPNVEQFFVMPS